MRVCELKNRIGHSPLTNGRRSGDKFKHAFKIDHKQHHTQQTNESALVSGA